MSTEQAGGELLPATHQAAGSSADILGHRSLLDRVRPCPKLSPIDDVMALLTAESHRERLIFGLESVATVIALIILVFAGLIIAQIALATSGRWGAFTAVAVLLAALSFLIVVIALIGAADEKDSWFPDADVVNTLNNIGLVFGLFFACQLAIAVFGNSKSRHDAQVQKHRTDGGNRRQTVPVKRSGSQSAEAIARSPHTPDETLRRMWTSSPELRKAIYDNPACPLDLRKEVDGGADVVDRYEKVLRDRIEMFGPSHMATVKARENLASAYRAAGRIADATDLERQHPVDSNAEQN